MSKYKQRQFWPGQPLSYLLCHCTSPCSPNTGPTDNETETLKRQCAIFGNEIWTQRHIKMCPKLDRVMKIKKKCISKSSNSYSFTITYLRCLFFHLPRVLMEFISTTLNYAAIFLLSVGISTSLPEAAITLLLLFSAPGFHQWKSVTSRTSHFLAPRCQSVTRLWDIA